MTLLRFVKFSSRMDNTVNIISLIASFPRSSLSFSFHFIPLYLPSRNLPLTPQCLSEQLTIVYSSVARARSQAAVIFCHEGLRSDP